MQRFQPYDDQSEMQGFKRKPPAPGVNDGRPGRPRTTRFQRLGRAFQRPPLSAAPGGFGQAGGVESVPQPGPPPVPMPPNDTNAPGLTTRPKWGSAQTFGGLTVGGAPTGPAGGGPVFQGGATDFARQIRPPQRMELPPPPQGPDGPPEEGGLYNAASDVFRQIRPPQRMGPPNDIAGAAEGVAGKVAPPSSGPFLPNGPDDEQYRKLFMS